MENLDTLSVLFVDDQPEILNGLRRMIRSSRIGWTTDFVTSGQGALAALEKNRFDVVISDMRMPHMSGAELLREVRQRYPKTLRIILSGYSDQNLVMESVGIAHQYLAKPCAADTLLATVKRAFAAQALLRNDRLRGIVSQAHSLPSVPSLYLEIVEELNGPDPSIKKVGEIVAKDIGMTSKLLQLVNSAFFGLSRQVSSPIQAATLLGAGTIKALALSVKVFSEFEGDRVQGFTIESLWQHSLLTGSVARLLSKGERVPQAVVDDAYLGGMLHDVGKLILAANLPEEYGQVIRYARSENISQRDAELVLLGSTHADVGGFLLGLWGLPQDVIEAVAWHHAPGESSTNGFSPLTAVHVANCLLAEAASGTGPDMEHIEALGLSERLPEWRMLSRSLLEVGVNA